MTIKLKSRPSTKPLHNPFPCITKRKVALVTGASGSGKTLIAKMFANAYVHTMDNYFRAPFKLLEGQIPNWDVPESVDFNAWITDYYKILQAIDVGTVCKIARYHFGTSVVSEQDFDGRLYHNTKWIVFEGIFALDPRLHHLADLKVFVDVPFEQRVARRVKRDMVERKVNGKGDLKFVLLHSYYTQKSYEKYIEPMKKLADLVIPNFEIQ